MNKLNMLGRGLLLASVCLSLNVTISVLGNSGLQAQEVEKQQRKTRRTPALRSKVYDQLARAQSLADNGNAQEAIAALDDVKRRASSMNAYELAMMYNFYGFIYYNKEDYSNAISSFENVVAQQPIPESFEQTTLYTLAQLHMMQGNYDETVDYLNRWEKLHIGGVPAKNLVLKAQAMYQKKDYSGASNYINQAIELREKNPDYAVAEENWYVLQRAVFYELKQPQKVKDVLVTMVKHFNKPEYWIQLSGMYGELGQEKAQLATLEAAYQQGYVTKKADIYNLAQLYYYHQVPYKGAALIENALDEGVMEHNLRNLKFLAQSWSMAKENEKAIPVMIAAAEMTDDGELDAQLAQIYLNLERFDDAIGASLKALEKGKLANEGIVHLVLGMAYYNKQQFVDALNQLAKAQNHKSSQGMAQQWRKFVENERASYQHSQSQLTAS